MIDSPPSTIPGDESSSSGPDHERRHPSNDAVGAENPTQSIMIDDSEKARFARCSLSTHANRPDYAYRHVIDIMDEATT